MTGTLPGGQELVYGVNEGGVGVGRIAPTARRYQFAVTTATRDLKSGKVS